MSTWNVTAARAALPEILVEVDAGGEVLLTRHGRPVAIIVRPDTLRARRASSVWNDADEIERLVTSAGTTDALSPTMAAERADELIADIRRGRDAR